MNKMKLATIKYQRQKKNWSIASSDLRLSIDWTCKCVCNLRELYTKSKFIFDVVFLYFVIFCLVLIHHLKFHCGCSFGFLWQPIQWRCISLIYEFEIFNRDGELSSYVHRVTSFLAAIKTFQLDLTFEKFITSSTPINLSFNIVSVTWTVGFFFWFVSEMYLWRYSNENRHIF